MPGTKAPPIKTIGITTAKIFAAITGAGMFGIACYALGLLIGLAGFAAFASGLGVVVGGVALINCAGYGIYRLVERVKEKRARRRTIDLWASMCRNSYSASSTSMTMSKLGIMRRSQQRDELAPLLQTRQIRSYPASPLYKATHFFKNIVSRCRRRSARDDAHSMAPHCKW